MTASNIAYAESLMATAGMSYQAAAIASGIYEPDLRRLAARPQREGFRPVHGPTPGPAAYERLRLVPPDDIMTPIDAIKRLIASVGEAHGFTYEQVMAPSTERGSSCHPLAHARQAAMYAVKEAYPKISRVRLGKIMGRDHSTVVYGLKAHEARLQAASGA